MSAQSASLHWSYESVSALEAPPHECQQRVGSQNGTRPVMTPMSVGRVSISAISSHIPSRSPPTMPAVHIKSVRGAI